MLNRAQFDAIEFDAARTGDHQTAAELMSELASTAVQSDSMPRAEAFVRAGEQWLLADNPEAAANGFRRALAYGGPAAGDARVPLARALFQLARAAEARSLIAAMRAEGTGSPRVCEQVAELLVEQSDLEAALDWATAGVELILGTDEGGRSQHVRQEPDTARQAAEAGDRDAELGDLLRLRFRIRNDLRLPEDGYDLMLDA